MDILERSGMTLTKSELLALIFLIKCYAHPQTHMKPMKVISYKKREEQMFALVLRGGQMIEMKKENLFSTYHIIIKLTSTKQEYSSLRAN